MIEVTVADPADRERAHQALHSLGCGEPQPTEVERQLTLPAAHDGVAMMSEASRALQETGIAVSDLALRRPTLDDVFLTLTGRPPEDEAPAAQGDGHHLSRELAFAEREEPPR
jgi:hypothetical protein